MINLKKTNGQATAFGMGITWHAADNPPKNPMVGDVYYDTNTGHTNAYDGTDWLQIDSQVPYIVADDSPTGEETDLNYYREENALLEAALIETLSQLAALKDEFDGKTAQA